MTIQTFISVDSAQPLETFDIADTTMGDWMVSRGMGYDHDEHQGKFIVEINGEALPPAEWFTRRLAATDDVRFCLRPLGGAFDAIGSIVSSVFKLFGLNLGAKVPDMNNNQVQGRDIASANLKANTAKPNGVIPELAGRRQVFPFYAVPLRKYFTEENGQTVQYVVVCAVVTVGQCQILQEEVTLGTTPLLSLGDAATFNVYQPGEDMSADPAHENWYPAPEVGSTSTGSAGLALKATTTVDRTAEITAVTFGGSTLTSTNATNVDDVDDVWTDAFPEGWSAGQILRIEQRQSVTFTGGNTVMTDFSRLKPSVGMPIEIVGQNAGEYVIATHTPATAGNAQTPGTEEQITLETPEGKPVTWLRGGNFDVVIGLRGLRYRIVSADRAVIEVDRLLADGSVDTQWPGFYAETVSATDLEIALDEYSVDGDWAGSYAACPAGTLTEKLQFDVMMNGLTRIKDNGNLRDASVEVEFQWRDMALGGEWTSVKRSWTRKTRDQLGFTVDVALPYAMRPECRMRRTTAESTSTQVIDAVEWYGLRAQLPVPTSYDTVTTVTAIIRGGNRLASQSENKLAVVATRILPVRRNGEWQAPQPTKDIIPWVMHAAKARGYTDDDLDLEELDRLDEIYRARGDTFNHLIDSGTVRDTIRNALSAGFAELTMDDGRILPVRDEPRTTFGHAYGRNKMIKGGELGISFELPKPDDYDGFDVTYISGITHTKETVQCRRPGDKGLKVKKLTYDFIDNADQAYHMGMREREKLFYRRWAFKWQTEMAALNSRYGEYVPVSSDVPGYGMDAQLDGMEAIGNGQVMLTLREPVEWEGDKMHVVAVTKPNGTLDGPYPATPGLLPNQVICQQLAFAPVLDDSMLRPVVHFGVAERWCFEVLINKVTPGDNNTKVTVNAENYHPGCYAYDNAPAPEPTPA